MTEQNSTFDPSLLGRTRERVSNIAGNEWLIFFFAIILYLVDLFWLKFDGVNLVKVYRVLGMDGLGNLLFKGILINAVFWVVLAFFFFIRRPENKEEMLSLLALIASVFFVATLVGLNTFISLSNLASLIHIVFIILAVRNGILAKKYSKTDANYYTIILVFLDFFAFNLIYSIFPNVNANYVSWVLIPVLPLYILVYIDESSRLRSWLLFLISAFYIIMVMSTYHLAANFQENLDQAKIEGGKEKALSTLDKLKNMVFGVKQSWNESQKMISGDYYTGQVEDYEAKPLGVFLEDVKPSDKEFIVNESQITVWATLKAYTLEKQKIDIDVTCSAKDGTKTIKGSVTPLGGKYYNIESYDEQLIVCTFKDTNISKKPGYYPVTINATFNFKTQSYLKTYYIEKERKRVLMSENIDIFNQYEITDRTPTAKFTNGPVMIGMETSTPPIGIPLDDYSTFSSFVGVTIDNNWKGNVKKINNLTIEIPEGLVFNSESCKFFNPLRNNIYSLAPEQLKTDNQKKYNLPKTFKCALSLNSPYNLLGQTPISLKYFKTNVDYVYQITESTSVNVKSVT